MAKTDWQLGDTVHPADMNQIGQEINAATAAAAVAQSTANNHAARHATGGPDEISPTMIGAETPAGAQAKADAAETSAKNYTDTVAEALTTAINAVQSAASNAQAAANTAQNTANNAVSAISSHAIRTDNPHGVTKAQVGLSNVPNYPPANQAEAEAGMANDRLMTPLATRQYVDKRMQNNLMFRVNNGVPEYSIDGGLTWQAMGASKTLVASDNVRYLDVTEYIHTGTSSQWMLVAKFVPKGTGEILIEFDISRFGIDNSALLYMFPIFNVNTSLPSPYIGNPSIDWRVPLGTLVNGLPHSGNVHVYSQHNYNYDTIQKYVSIFYNTPIYFVAGPYTKIKNFKIKYDEIN